VNLSAPFIARPVATTLLTIGLALAGAVAFAKLPVSPLPKVDYPTIQVSAGLPGASPETVASSLTTPLERALGAIAGVTEMTSTSTVTCRAASTARRATCRPPSMPRAWTCRAICRPTRSIAR
jgi:multidrug efflux pump